MTERERRQVLEAIARDENNYARDRIAAVKALEDIARRAKGEMDAELERVLDGKQ